MKRLTPASLTFGVMAIMGLLVAAYVVRSLWATEQKEVAISTRNMPTPVADLPIGTEITEKHLGMAPIRTDELTPDMLANKNIIIGRVVREPLKKAQPVRANQLYAPGERPQLQMAKGQQALTLPFDSVTTIVDGLIRPGDHCDIRFTLNPAYLRSDTRVSQAFQMTLFKAVKVLAINRNVVQQQPEAGNNTVTLEVSPKQANALLLARTYGVLNLTYTQDLTPGGIEIADADADRLTIEKLLNLPEKRDPPPPPKPAEPHRVDVYRGLTHGVMTFTPKGRVITGGGFNSMIPNDLNSVQPVPNSSLVDPNATPANGIPGTGGPAINGAGANGVTGLGPTAAVNPQLSPTRMATPTAYAHQPVGQVASQQGTNVLNQSGFGPANNAPQFYGQSAPGQVTGPGYTVAPGFTPGAYGNVPYFSAQ